jgi:WD40 repeat protein
MFQHPALIVAAKVETSVWFFPPRANHADIDHKAGIIALAHENNMINILRVREMRAVQYVGSLIGHTSAVDCVKLDLSKNRIYSAGKDGIRVWHFDAGDKNIERFTHYDCIRNYPNLQQRIIKHIEIMGDLLITFSSLGELIIRSHDQLTSRKSVR